MASTSGSIPAELGQLFELELLILNDNKLVGGSSFVFLPLTLSESAGPVVHDVLEHFFISWPLAGVVETWHAPVMRLSQRGS